MNEETDTDQRPPLTSEELATRDRDDAATAATLSAPEKKRSVALGERGLRFESANEVFQIAQALVQSRVTPEGMTAGGALAAIIKGRTFGLDEITSVTSITVVKGRVTLSGSLILAVIRQAHVCRANPTFGYDGEGAERSAWVQAWRKEDPAPVRVVFRWQDAVKAGLTKNTTYTKYADNMLLWRAVANFGRMHFPDILAGVYVPGEVEGTVDETGPRPVDAASLEPPPAGTDPLLDMVPDESKAHAEAPTVPAPPPPAGVAESQSSQAPSQAPSQPEPELTHADADRAIAAAEAREADELFLTAQDARPKKGGRH